MAIFSHKRHLLLCLHRNLHSSFKFDSTRFRAYSTSIIHPLNPILQSSPFSSTSTPLKILSPLMHKSIFKTAFNGGRTFATQLLESSSGSDSSSSEKETMVLEGCDFEHWLIVVDSPDPWLTRDEIIDGYIRTLAEVIGSEEEARMKIYSVSTRHYFAFGALISEELGDKLKKLPHVRWVLPDSYMDYKNKTYSGEPFINGKAVPYDPKYHEVWVRNHGETSKRTNNNQGRQKDPNSQSRLQSASTRGSSSGNRISSLIRQNPSPETSNTQSHITQPSSASNPVTHQQNQMPPDNSPNDAAQTSQSAQMQIPSHMQNHVRKQSPPTYSQNQAPPAYSQNQAPATYSQNQVFQRSGMHDNTMSWTPPPPTSGWASQSHVGVPSVGFENQAQQSYYVQNQTPSPASASTRGSSSGNWISSPIPRKNFVDTSNTQDHASQLSPVLNPVTQQQNWMPPYASPNVSAPTARSAQMQIPSHMQNHAQKQAPPTYSHNQAPPTFSPNQAPYSPNQAPPPYSPNQAPYSPNQAPPPCSPNQAPPPYSPNQAAPPYSPNQALPPFYPNQAAPPYSPNQAPPTYSPNQAPPTYSQTPPTTQGWTSQSQIGAPSVGFKIQARESYYMQNQTPSPSSTSGSYDPARHGQSQSWGTSTGYQSHPPQTPVPKHNSSYNNPPPSAPSTNHPYHRQTLGPDSEYQIRSPPPPTMKTFSYDNVPPSAHVGGTVPAQVLQNGYSHREIPHHAQNDGFSNGYSSQSFQQHHQNNYHPSYALHSSTSVVTPSAQNHPYHRQTWGPTSEYQIRSPPSPTGKSFSYNNFPPSAHDGGTVPAQVQHNGYPHMDIPHQAQNDVSSNGYSSQQTWQPASGYQIQSPPSDHIRGSVLSQVQQSEYFHRDIRHQAQNDGSSNGNSSQSVVPPNAQSYQNTNVAPSTPRDVSSQWNQQMSRREVQSEVQQNGYYVNNPPHLQNNGAHISQYQQYQQDPRGVQSSNATIQNADNRGKLPNDTNMEIRLTRDYQDRDIPTADYRYASK